MKLLAVFSCSFNSSFDLRRPRVTRFWRPTTLLRRSICSAMENQFMCSLLRKRGCYTLELVDQGPIIVCLHPSSTGYCSLGVREN